MNCIQADVLIQNGLDGRLSPAERTRLDAHLTGCAACRAAWDEYRCLSRTAAAWTQRAAVPDDPGGVFTAQVLARIASQPQQARPGPRGLAWAGVCFVLLTVASFWAGPRLPVRALPMSPTWNVPSVDWVQTASALMHDVLHDWDALTAHQDLPRWIWSALAVVLAANGAFAWRALRPAPETGTR